MGNETESRKDDRSCDTVSKARRQDAQSARLKRLLKNSISARFVSGHDFSRADKLFVLVIPSGLQPARDLLFQLFQQLVKPCRRVLYNYVGFSPCPQRLKPLFWIAVSARLEVVP